MHVFPVIVDDDSKNQPRVSQNIFVSKNHSNEFLNPKRNGHERSQYGVVCECCINPCTLREMQAYCAKKRKRRSVHQGSTPVYTKSMLEEFQQLIASSPSLTLQDLAQTPLVQALNQQKIRNSQKEGNSKREGNFFEYSDLTQVLPESVDKYNHDETTSRSSEQKLSSKESSILRRIWQALTKNY